MATVEEKQTWVRRNGYLDKYDTVTILGPDESMEKRHGRPMWLVRYANGETTTLDENWLHTDFMLRNGTERFGIIQRHLTELTGSPGHTSLTEEGKVRMTMDEYDRLVLFVRSYHALLDNLKTLLPGENS